MLHLYILLLSSALLPAVMLLLFPQPVKEIFRDLRIMRILHYVALALFGVALSSNTTRDNNFFTSSKTG